MVTKRELRQMFKGINFLLLPSYLFLILPMRLFHWFIFASVKFMEKYKNILDSISDTIGYIFLELILEAFLLAFALFVIFERLRPVIDKIETNPNNWWELLKMEFSAHSIEWGIFIFVFLVWVILKVSKYLSDIRKANKLQDRANKLEDKIDTTNFILLNMAKNQGIKIDELMADREVKNERNNPNK